MALDHTRHFFYGDLVDHHGNLNEVWLFFVRFITIMCAPAFLLLAGFSIRLSQHDFTGKMSQTFFLLKRGLILIILELTIMNCFWDTTMFYVEFQILWVFGLSFMIMALFIHLPRYVNMGLAIILIVFQHLLEQNTSDFRSSFLGAVLYYPAFMEFGKIQIQFLYTIIPWMPIMMLGYGMSGIFETEPVKRRRLFIWSGVLMIISFLILRSINKYGDLHPWTDQVRERIFDVVCFLNITKYPASLDFLLVALGISFIMLALFDKVKSNQLRNIRMLGNVALFFYIIHVPVIKVITKVYFYFLPNPPGPLVLFLTWIFVVLVLWLVCRYYQQFRSARKDNPKYFWFKYF